jgi:hypothetical protein
MGSACHLAMLTDSFVPFSDGSLRAYVDALETFCLTSQLLDLHLANFTSSPNATPTPNAPAPNPDAYSKIPEPVRAQIKTRLVSASQFFGQVVVTVILRDLGLLLERHGKMSGQWVSGP